MNSKKTAENLYREGTDVQFENDKVLLGPWTSYSLMTDPKHLSFVLARYKFTAKMLNRPDNKRNVLEVGCGDGVGIPITAQSCKSIVAVDWDRRLTEDNTNRLGGWLKNVEFINHDFNTGEITDIGPIDGIYMIDVIEHIDPDNEDNFMRNILKCYTTKEDAIMLVGTPNISASQYASKQSAIQHINLKSMDTLRELMNKYFVNVFTFGMNDEVLHTGYDPMCHYIWALGCTLKG